MANTKAGLILTMIEMPRLNLGDYQYDLPDERIARYPLPQRDQSRLLVYSQAHINHSKFSQITDFLPVESVLFFNNTKVVPARILFEKPTGGRVEVFLLNPANPNELMSEALQSKSPTSWKCAVGNARRWSGEIALTKDLGGAQLFASWNNRGEGVVDFRWTPSEIPFARVIDAAGAVPLPPYLKREADVEDRERYQTVYSRHEGAVAAPTAGLHFTAQIMEALQTKGIRSDFLTLHVSAGTFLPVKVQNPAEHQMHEEEIIVYKHNIINLLEGNRKVIAVGTTAMRTLESLYWFGAALHTNPEAPFRITQDSPYAGMSTVSTQHALEALLKRMEQLDTEQLVGHTSIFIRPGYEFKVTKGLVTNFHQPGSTLLLLIAAFVGNAWKEIYREALDHPYRFLSYGDSSLLLP